MLDDFRCNLVCVAGHALRIKALVTGRVAPAEPDIRVIVIEPGAVATELTDHIIHADSMRAATEATTATHIEPLDIAEVIAFAVSCPRRVALSEILVRPTAQAL